MTVFRGFDPLGFEDRVGFDAIERFVLTQLFRDLRVELDGDEMKDNLEQPILYAGLIAEPG